MRVSTWDFEMSARRGNSRLKLKLWVWEGDWQGSRERDGRGHVIRPLNASLIF